MLLTHKVKHFSTSSFTFAIEMNVCKAAFTVPIFNCRRKRLLRHYHKLRANCVCVGWMEPPTQLGEICFRCLENNSCGLGACNTVYVIIIVPTWFLGDGECCKSRKKMVYLFVPFFSSSAKFKLTNTVKRNISLADVLNSSLLSICPHTRTQS